MKTVIKNEAGFSELFDFAKERFGILWNPCCDMFHRTELLNYGRDTDFELGQLKEDLDPQNKYAIKDPKRRKGVEVVIAFMQSHGVDSITIV